MGIRCNTAKSSSFQTSFGGTSNRSSSTAQPLSNPAIPHSSSDSSKKLAAYCSYFRCIEVYRNFGVSKCVPYNANYAKVGAGDRPNNPQCKATASASVAGGKAAQRSPRPSTWQGSPGSGGRSDAKLIFSERTIRSPASFRPSSQICAPSAPRQPACPSGSREPVLHDRLFSIGRAPFRF